MAWGDNGCVLLGQSLLSAPVHEVEGPLYLRGLSNSVQRLLHS